MNIENHILRAISENDGIEVKKLEVGTKLFVQTMNSLYELKIMETREGSTPVKIKGGTLSNGNDRYEDESDASFIGSTFGGSIIKLNWIGNGMRMELCHNHNKILTTSPVKNVVVEAADESWAYSMDWNNEDQS